MRTQIQTEADTVKLGQRLAAALPPGSVVSLVGNLGAGKTRLVQAFAQAWGAAEGFVTSPTFVLINEYHTPRGPIYHIDAYRLKDDDEFLNLGPEEYFASNGVTFIEWGNRVERCLPPDAIEIAIEIGEGDARVVTIRGFKL